MSAIVPYVFDGAPIRVQLIDGVPWFVAIDVCAVLGIDVGGYRDRIGISVCALSIIQFNDHGPRLDRLGDRSHLRPELRSRIGT